VKTYTSVTVKGRVFDMPMRKTKLAELGTSIEEVAKFNIKKGSFIIYTKAGKEIKTPIKNMRGCVREASRWVR
jgi:coenzyme F420-reducing hydrogenase beta subunit